MSYFRLKNEFSVLVKKYISGKATVKEISFLEKYYHYFDKEEDIINIMSSEEKAFLEKKMLVGIYEKASNKTKVFLLSKSLCKSC